MDGGPIVPGVGGAGMGDIVAEAYCWCGVAGAMGIDRVGVKAG